MRMQQLLFSVIASVGVLGTPLVASADEGGGPPPLPRKEVCKENPGKCDEARARRREFCQANPEKCKQMEEKRAQRREFCKANPAKCKAQREQMRAKRAEMRARCEADPARCEDKKDEARERVKDRKGGPR